MTYFKDFMEDYNTATMPHEKYYNYERWEMEEYRRKQQAASSGGGSSSSSSGGDVSEYTS
jgi:hypothetical protein